jgi:hypothetical protein
MIKNHKRILQALINIVIESYNLSKDDRKDLHQLEWGEDDKKPSILGEAEIRADAIIGLSKRFIKSRVDNKVDALKVLNNYGVYCSNILLSWLLDEGDKYKKFSLYLHQLEHLRLVLENIIVERIER